MHPTAPHNKKIREIIKREKSKGSKHKGGGSKKEVIIDTGLGKDPKKPYRRMDATFNDKDGKEYHINVGLENQDGTPIKRERDAIEDVKGVGKDIKFEPYGKRSNKKKT